MQMLSTPRIFSNKENSPSFTHSPSHPSPSPSPSLHSSPKPRGKLGLGRAPSSRTRPHSSKPYARTPSSSIHRAKVKAGVISTSPSPQSSLVKLEPQSPTPAARRRARPAPIHTNLEVIEERRATKIPLRIPMPIFPPIAPLEIESVVVPAEYVSARLAPHLFNVLLVSSLFHPFPDVPPPSPSSSTSDTSRLQSMAFAIPQVIDGTNPSLGPKSRGLEPDVCLAVAQRGNPSLPVRLVPTTNIVYASKCAYWPRTELAKQEPEELSYSPCPPLSPASSTSSSATVVPGDGIEHELEVPSSPSSTSSQLTATQSAPSSPHSSSAYSSSSSSSSSTSSTSTSTSTSTSSFLHLPVVSIDVPSLSTFSLLHTHLHTPGRPFAPALLGLGSADYANADRPQLVVGIEKLSTAELLKRLEVIHGVWQNVCALGVAAEATWTGIGMAWGCVVGVLAIRSAGVSKMEE